MKKLLFCLSLFFVCGVQIYADVPKKLNIQGKLTSDSGQVLAEKSFDAVLHIRASGASGENYPVDNKSAITDSNGLYNLNFDIASFNFNAGSQFKIAITVDGQTITTAWSDITTNPYSFYSSTAAYSNSSSTATYSKILDPNQPEKLVDGNFNQSVAYKINVTTAVAVSTASYTAGNSYIWGIGTDGVQKWTNPDIQVSSASYAFNAGTATYSNASSYSLNSGTAAYALRISTVPLLAVGDAQVWTITNVGGNIYQSWDTVVSGLKAGDGLKLTGKTISVSPGSGVGFDGSNNLIVSDTGITPAKLQQGGGVLYNILVSTANNLSASFKLADTNFNTNYVYLATVTYATNAGVAASMKTAGSGPNLFWGYDSSGTNQLWRTVVVSSSNVAGLSGATVANATNAASATIAVTAVTASSMTAGGGANSFWGYDGGSAQGWRSLAAGNGIGISGYSISVATGAGLGFSGSSLIVTTAPYAAGAGTATTVVDGAITAAKIGSLEITSGKLAADSVIAAKIAAGAVTETKIGSNAIISSHFKYESDYGHVYDIKVATAAYAETAGADLAEMYSSTELLVPGDVVSIDTAKDNAIVKTKVADDTMVVGVISTKPGLLMNKTEKGYELALVGKVPTKVCNEGGSIKRGDMLVSASMAGYAKKAGDNPKTGTVIGKALENFDSVTGTILVLVNLQ